MDRTGHSERRQTGSDRTAHHEDTIFAVATGGGRSAIAVLRVSGPQAIRMLEQVSGPAPAPRTLSLRKLVDPRNQVALDHGLVAVFPQPASYTGEDMVELHLHGGRAVIASLVDVLGSIPGLRPASPGEFSRRAFENGKLDLTAAEGIADLVNAETELQRRQALRQLEGALGRLCEGWREALIGVLARLEAYIDFPDEDLPAGLTREVREIMARLAGEISAHLADNQRGERLREGISVAILGAPNSGKSSLLNYLAGRDAAIVSSRAGTTRDVVEVRLDLGGYVVDLADTAGLREAVDEIEAEGVRRALQRAENADINILLLDGSKLPRIDAGTQKLQDDRSIVVISRIDLAPPNAVLPAGLPLSIVSGDGLPQLLGELEARVQRLAGLAEAPALTRARHRQALMAAESALRGALAAEALELTAEELRLAVRALGSITGRVDIEDVLDVIFRQFCIGK